MPLVFNASPLIVLAKAGLLDRLIELGDPAWVPQAVVDEILHVDDESDPARRWFEQDSIPIQVIPTPPMSPFLTAWDLDAGESAVISLAAGHAGDAVAVLEDLARQALCGSAWHPIHGDSGIDSPRKKTGHDRLSQRVAGADHFRGAPYFAGCPCRLPRTSWRVKLQAEEG